MSGNTILVMLICCLGLPLSAPAQSGELLNPPEGAIGIQIPVPFDWADGGGNVWFLEVSENVDFTSLTVSSICYSSEYPASGLIPNRAYYWRVRYGTDYGGVVIWAEYSASSSFRTAVAGCCVGDRGNFDGDADEHVNVSDLVFMVEYLFGGGAPVPCPDEGDISPPAAPDGSINVADLVAMVSYLFQGGSASGPCPGLIHIVGLEPGDNLVHGVATVLDTAACRVVLWARTDKWYVQPSVGAPFTYIQGDGTWSNSTYPWDRMLALLVDSTYVPGATRTYHPAADPGVLAWDEYPDNSVPYIYWSTYRWQVKTGDLIGPGPNYFSDDTANVRVDSADRLHLKIDYRDSRWYCAEVVLDHSLGYGTYTFKLDSRVDSLDYNTILGCFTYETLNREFDFEFSQRLANPFNAQYVVQPWYTPGNIVYYHMPNVTQSTHRFEWRSNQIIFTSWSGHSDAPGPLTLINTWTYTGGDIPPPGGERMRFNLHLYGGEAPLQGVEDEVIITSFEYTQ